MIMIGQIGFTALSHALQKDFLNLKDSSVKIYIDKNKAILENAANTYKEGIKVIDHYNVLLKDK